MSMRYAGYIGIVILAVYGASAVAADMFPDRQVLWHRYFGAETGLISEYRREEIPRDNRDRCRAARELFLEVGAGDAAVEPLTGEAGDDQPGNVVAVLAGGEPGAIIVSAHFDRAGSGSGAVDDFSGVVMQAALFGFFRGRPHRHTLVFVAFAGEETGQEGSRAFIEAGRFAPGTVTAVVNLECLGVVPPHSWSEGSSENLEAMLTRVGKKRGMDCGPVSIAHVSADSVPFLYAGYPAITIQGIGPEHIGLLGTDWDRPSVVRPDILEATFAVLVDFIAALDVLAVLPDLPVGDVLENTGAPDTAVRTKNIIDSIGSNIID
jgi:Zn-dependent M28 family amino/carboxypeptidase